MIFKSRALGDIRMLKGTTYPMKSKHACSDQNITIVGLIFKSQVLGDIRTLNGTTYHLDVSWKRQAGEASSQLGKSRPLEGGYELIEIATRAYLAIRI